MIVFFTRATQHLAHTLSFQQGKYLSKQFSDGEWYVQLEQDVRSKDVWVLAATNPPAEHVMELLLLLDALLRNEAHIKIVFTYFGYARQDEPAVGEASSAQLMAKIMNLFRVEKIIIIHPHSVLLHTFLKFQAVIPDELICHIAHDYDTFAAPDEGAQELVKHLAHVCNKEMLLLTKTRPEHESVKVLECDGNASHKRILIIDDMIATGNTVIEVAKKLKASGAERVSVWATHGVFSAHAAQKIDASIIDRVYVTDSLPQKNSSVKIKVVSIAPLIEKIIKQN